MRANRILTILCASAISASFFFSFGTNAMADVAADTNEVTIRVCSWEEYIDLGGWAEDEVIDLESGDIFGENSVVEDFKQWYLETYGIKVNVEYSTFGTNEDLYNMLTIGDVYDLVCPSEYMVMKLIAEDMAVPLSEDFFDTSNENNYYARMVSPYINEIFMNQEINGEAWGKYMAGYMWGITGIVYNPDEVTDEEASTIKILNNPKFCRRITIKDSVRESYFAALGAIKSDLLTSPEFTSSPDYKQALEDEMNDTSKETISEALDFLQSVKDNTYSFETDSGKADMITGKVVANYQWSGDAVYTLDQAEEDDCYLNFAVPVESSNIYFDGWVMLKNGVGDDALKRHACEAFINFLSRPDIAIRNMYYIGYTSCIAGSEDDQRVFEYADWCYGADDDEDDTTDYPLGYFFSNDENDKDYILNTPTSQLNRQLSAQYPDPDSINRTSIMRYFDKDTYAAINSMWINVRCFNLYNIPIYAWIIAAAVIASLIVLAIKYRKR